MDQQQPIKKDHSAEKHIKIGSKSLNFEISLHI
jgi:hypothetical protein